MSRFGGDKFALALPGYTALDGGRGRGTDPERVRTRDGDSPGRRDDPQPHGQRRCRRPRPRSPRRTRRDGKAILRRRRRPRRTRRPRARTRSRRSRPRIGAASTNCLNRNSSRASSPAYGAITRPASLYYMSTVVLDGIGFPFEPRKHTPAPLSPPDPREEAGPRRAGTGTPIAAPRASGSVALDDDAESLAREQISRLVSERHRLREERRDRGQLEQNRLAIVTAQHEFSHALIARYKPGF